MSTHLSEGIVKAHNKQVIEEVRKHNKNVQDGIHKDMLHEIDCVTKDVKNYNFNGRQHFTISGFGERKEKLSTKIYRAQCYLNKNFPLYRATSTVLRKVKNLFSRKSTIPGLPRVFK